MNYLFQTQFLSLFFLKSYDYFKKKAQNDMYKNPEMLRMLSEQQEKLFEKSRNQTEA